MTPERLKSEDDEEGVEVKDESEQKDSKIKKKRRRKR